MLSIDLNLLAVFDALYELRSTTRAAGRLNLTQSAVSHSLRRLRDTLGDPLFIRSGRTLQPTARAGEMAPLIREGLSRFHHALSPGNFDPATANRTFSIAAGAYFCTLFIPDLIIRTSIAAPGITLRVAPVGQELLSALDDGSIDLALGAFGQVPTRLRIEPLFHDDLVWIAASNNPLAGRPVSLEEIMASPRLRIGAPPPFGLSTSLSANFGLEINPVADLIGRRTSDTEQVSGVVYDSLTAVTIAGQTDMVALVPRRLATAHGKRLGITILAIDWVEAGFDVAMLWHGRFDTDEGATWLRSQLRAAAHR